MLRMTDEPDDYEGPWPREDAMTTDEAREFFKFLNGEVPWNGTWFGEYAPGERGAYWWRKHLKDAIESLIAVPMQQAEPVYLVATGDIFAGEDTYTRHTTRPPHSDSEILYAHPPAAEVQRLRDVLAGLLEHYISLVNSGDAGNWDAEKEPEVIAARRALEGGE